MRTVDTSTNAQLNNDDSEGDFGTAEEKIDGLAGDMAAKAGSVQKKHEDNDTVGGVRSNSGGLFTK